MMKKSTLFSALLLLCTSALADGPWKMTLNAAEQEAKLKIDLYEESVDVPGMEMFGPMNGYLKGKGIYGTWMVTSYEIKSDKEAYINLSNDLGSETQKVKLTAKSDSIYLFEQVSGSVIKKAVNRKLVKIPSRFEMKLK